MQLKLKPEYIGKEDFVKEMGSAEGMLWIQTFEELDQYYIEEAQHWRVDLLGNDYKDKAVLDVGCANGFYAIRASQLGASRVVAIDIDMRNFELSRNFAFMVYENNVQFIEENVLKLAQWEPNQFDTAIFMGVIYHMKNPLGGIEAVANVLKPGGEMFLETLALPSEEREPIARFLEGSEVNNDPTNWFKFSETCVEAMMRTAGLENVKTLSRYGSNRAFLYGVKK